jgi:hypothetical protein
MYYSPIKKIMRHPYSIPFLNALSIEKQIRLQGFATIRIIKKIDKKHFKDSSFIDSRYLPEHLCIAVRIAPTIGDFCGLIFTREDEDESTKTTTKTTASLKKNGGGTLMLG